MVLVEKDITDIKLYKIIGEPIKLDMNDRRSIGSCSFFLKSFDSIATNNGYDFKIDAKCNFQKYSNGILIRINYSNRLNALAINNKDIIRIELIKGQENITPYLFSLMKILIKLNVPIRYARYFGLRNIEYKITETIVKVYTTDLKMKFITNGFDYENQLPFFKNLNLGDKLKLIKKPTYNK